MAFDGLDIAAVFGDDEGEYNPLVTTPAVNLPQPSIVVGNLSVVDASTASPLEFDTHVSVDFINAINMEFRRLWHAGYDDRICLPRIDESQVLNRAVNNLKDAYDAVPENIVDIVQRFNEQFSYYFGQGDRGADDWDCEKHTALSRKVSAANVMWEFFMPKVKKPLHPPQLDAAPSASKWILEALGGKALTRADANTNEVQGSESASVHQQKGRPEHHLNFQGQWLHEKSNNPSSVSLFAAVTASRQEVVYNHISCKAVTKSQAAKRVDPFEFDGDLNSINEQVIDSKGNIEWKWKGTALRDLATGRTSIVYEPHGTWGSDEYDDDEDVPLLANGRPENSAALDSSGQHLKYKGLQWPYFMSKEEDRDVIINDDGKGRPFPSQKQKDERNCGPSPLRLVTDHTGIESWTEPQTWEFGEYLMKGEKKDASSLRTENTADVKEVSTADLLVEASYSEAEDQCGVYEQTAPQSATDIEDASDSEAETDIQSNSGLQREPINYVEPSLDLLDTENVSAEEGEEVYVQSDQPPSSPDDFDIEAMYKQGRDCIAKLTASHWMLRSNMNEFDEDDSSVVEGDQESFDSANGITDQASIWTKQANLVKNPKADILWKFSEANTSQSSKHRLERESSEDLEPKTSDFDRESAHNVRHASGKQALHSLEDGWYISPSKMALSRIDEVHTPIQSPSKEQDYGSWEVNESGVHETPRRILAFQADDETGAEKFCNAAKRRSVLREHSSEKPFVVGAVFNPLSRSRIPIPTNRQPAGNSQDDEDVFSSRPAQSSIQTRVNTTSMTSPQSASSTGSMLEIQRVRRSRPFKPSVSPIAETESDVDEATSSKELVVWKAPGSRKLARSLSNQDCRGAVESSSNIRDFAVSSSLGATKHVSTEESKSHSRSSSSSENPSNVTSNTHSRSSSLSEPFSDADVQEELVLEIDAKPKELAAPAVTNPIESPLEKHVKHLVRACASLPKRSVSGGNTHAFRKDWLKTGEMRWAKSPSLLEEVSPVAHLSKDAHTTGSDAERDNLRKVQNGGASATTTNTPPAKAADAKPFSTCHYPVADIAPTQPQPPVAVEAGDVVELENGDGSHMKWLEAEMIGPLIGLAVVGLACKVIQKVIWKTPW